MSDLIVLSPCFYKDSSPADLMVKSARHYGLKTYLYGINQPFIPHGADAQVLKLWELMNYEKLADYVLVTDCRDVLFLAGEREILGKFTSKVGRGILMSTENGCWPPDPEIVQFFQGFYVNAGQYIGTWEEVKAALRVLLDKYRDAPDRTGPDNSQGWWMWAYMRKEIDFDIDVDREVFYSMSGGMDLHFDRHHPCSVHFNGNPGNDGPQQEMYRRLFG